jgi:hypothetical protein
MYYLESSVDSDRVITSFDRFGIKQLSLNISNNTNVIFTNEDVEYNPPEVEIPVHVNLPEGFHSSGTRISISVPGMFKSSDYPIGGVFTEGKVLIPLLPGNEFKIKIFNQYQVSGIPYSYSQGEHSILVNPGEPVNMALTKHINLLNPVNNGENIDGSASFEISDSEGPAVYEFSMVNSKGQILRIYTNKKTLKFSDFQAREFDLSPNRNYFWWVRKFPNFNNVDEFLTQPYVLDMRYYYIELSELRQFKTAP